MPTPHAVHTADTVAAGTLPQKPLLQATHADAPVTPLYAPAGQPTHTVEVPAPGTAE